MALENFRSQKIIWDRANKKIFETIEANSGDSNGRKLVVQVINQETTENLFGTTLSLGWKSRKGAKGLDAFNAVDASKGIFEIYYTTEMLSNIGNLEASLILIDSTSRIESSTFTISVRPSTVDDESVESENSFTALTEALVKVNDFDARLAETESQLNKKVGDGILATMGDLSQEVKESMTGGSVAVVGEGAVTKLNLANDVKAEIEVPIDNGINNPDFTGTTEWVGGGGSISAVGNVLSVTSNRSSFDPRAQQLSLNIPYVSGHKIYVKGKFKPVSANVDLLKIWLTSTGMTTIGAETSNFTLNDWNDFTAIITLGSGGSGNLGIWYSFHMASLVSAKQGELKEVFATDLTAGFGEGNEPSKEAIDKMFSYYPNNWFKEKANLAKTVQYTLDKADKSALLPIEAKLNNVPRKVGDNSVIITFDGSWENVVSSGAIDELEKIGGRATFFPNTTVLNQAGYLTSAQLLDLHNRGHEIGVYGSTASSNMLTGMTNTEVDAMLRARQADVKAIIGENPRSMAYPQGSANLNTHKIATRYFDRVRLTNLRWMMPNNAFVAFAHPSVVDSNVNDTISAIKHASKHDKDLVLIFHTIQSTGGTSIENFKAILQAIVDNNMRCQTLDTVMSRYNLIDDPWYDYPLTTTYANAGWVKNNESVSIEEGVGIWGDKALTISGTGRADIRTMLEPTYPNYILSVPYKLTGRTAGSLVISVRYADAMDTYLSNQAIVVSADTDWTNGRIEMTLPDGAASATIRLESSGLNAGAKCYFGRIVLSPTYAGDFTSEPI